jgi:hypothetical protein
VVDEVPVPMAEQPIGEAERDVQAASAEEMVDPKTAALKVSDLIVEGDGTQIGAERSMTTRERSTSFASRSMLMTQAQRPAARSGSGAGRQAHRASFRDPNAFEALGARRLVDV